jgi:hypothetical protein
MVTRSSNRRGPCQPRDWQSGRRQTHGTARHLRGSTLIENPDADSPGGARGDPEQGAKRDQVSAESTQPLHDPSPRGYRNAGLHAAAISECEALRGPRWPCLLPETANAVPSIRWCRSAYRRLCGPSGLGRFSARGSSVAGSTWLKGLYLTREPARILAQLWEYACAPSP